MKRLVLLFLLAGWVGDVQGAPVEGFPSGAIYVACHKDKQFGVGTQDGPLDGSTAAKFDAILARLPAHRTVFLGPGTFQTLGAVGFNAGFGSLPEGCRLVGSGVGATIVQLSPKAMDHAGTTQPQYFAVLESKGNTDDCEVSDLTVDCNVQNMRVSNPGDAIQGVVLNGSRCAIRRVEVTHAYAGELEGFTLYIGPLYLRQGDVADNIIEDCQVHDYVNGKNADGIVIGFSYDKAMGIIGTRRGIIRNNRVDGGRMGYLCGGSDGRIEGNYAKAACGFYGDSGTMDRITVVHNVFDVTEKGIDIAPDKTCHFSDLTFQENTVWLAGSRACAFYFGASNGKGGSGAGCRVVGNTVHTRGGFAQTLMEVGSVDWNGGLVTDNVSEVDGIKLAAPGQVFQIAHNQVCGVWVGGPAIPAAGG